MADGMDLVRRARTAAIKQAAVGAGFDLVGVAPAARPERFGSFLDALAAGWHADLGWLARADSLAQRADPTLLLPGARSLVCVAAGYYRGEEPADRPALPGRVARYARGGDYHEVLATRLRPVIEAIEQQGGRARAFVDGGPLCEVAHAARAGLGWIGKNTLLLHPRGGTWWLLAEVLCDLDLEFDEPVQERCGTCTACLDACPTQAFPEPYRLDAGRCISYLTIELKGPIPRELRPKLGDWIFGCDICQEACPWSRRFARPAEDVALAPRRDLAAADLLELLGVDDDSFRARFRGSPLWRAKRRGLLRNVCVALGNLGAPEAGPALVAALSDAEPLVRGHAAWALGRIGGHEAGLALAAALAGEADPWVREELLAAAGGA